MGYRTIPTIGPLFLVQVIAGALLVVDDQRKRRSTVLFG
jgi:hypothetical protein